MNINPRHKLGLPPTPVSVSRISKVPKEYTLYDVGNTEKEIDIDILQTPLKNLMSSNLTHVPFTTPPQPQARQLMAHGKVINDVPILKNQHTNLAQKFLNFDIFYLPKAFIKFVFVNRQKLLDGVVQRENLEQLTTNLLKKFMVFLGFTPDRLQNNDYTHMCKFRIIFVGPHLLKVNSHIQYRYDYTIQLKFTNNAQHANSSFAKIIKSYFVNNHCLMEFSKWEFANNWECKEIVVTGGTFRLG
ncbi:hypothetical protein DAMA08_040720 [Martiniozyma asiatica (nom. inval.)]|nr:hypothetical protein DAMA08_040720 [Martiniozyma asiatica]